MSCDDMESTSENLNNISEDLKQLTGKTIELTREKKRLTNHRDVSTFRLLNIKMTECKVLV